MYSHTAQALRLTRRKRTQAGFADYLLFPKRVIILRIRIIAAHLEGTHGRGAWRGVIYELYTGKGKPGRVNI